MFIDHLLIHIEVPLDFNQLIVEAVNKLEKKVLLKMEGRDNSQFLC